MAAIANIVINDGQGTPAAHTFNPVSHSGSSYVYREAGTTSLLAAAIITLSQLPVKGAGGVEKFRKRIVVPALETATGQNSSGYTAGPKIAYTLQNIEDFIVPSRATLAQRSDIFAYSRNLNAVAQTQWSDMVLTGQNPY